MKKIATIFGLLSLALAPAFAQTEEQPANEQKKGIILGVDNDEKDYLVGAPADNWFLGVGAGIQTYIDNQLEKDHRWNPITPAFNLEIGKWLIPDVAVSLQFQGFNSVSQTRYSLNPFTDYTGVANTTGHLPYHEIHHVNMSLMGFVTLDWTNLFLGYEKGYAKKVHILTPVGLGATVVTGQKLNKSPKCESTHSHELSFAAAFIPMITLSENIRLVPALRLNMARGTLNLGPYNDEQPTCRFDFMPSATIGLNINLSGTRDGATHKTRYKGDVATYHIFVPVENSHTMQVIYDRLAALKADNAALQGDNDALAGDNAGLKNKLADADALAAALAADLAKAKEAGVPVRALNPMEEILLNTGENGNALVYFDLNSSKLDLNAHRRLENFVDYVKNSAPETKFYIIGAADSATGNDRINDELSINRCKAVYNKLVKECGLNPAKFELRPLGGIAEYGINELNRLGLVVETNSELTAIVDKWSKKY